MKRSSFWIGLLPAIVTALVCSMGSIAQNPDHLTVIKPAEIDEVLANPGMGFMTFQRSGEEKAEPAGKGFPVMTITYWRKYWRLIEPEKDQYRWDLIDKALEEARIKGQTVLIRICPYGTRDEEDVPGWYRELVGPNRKWKYQSEVNGWMVDAEDPRYAEHFGGMIRELGARYDGHPDLEAVDISIVGAWGEGAGSELLSREAREALVNAYTESFTKTPLIALMMDRETNMYADSRIPVGWRMDCLGDLGFWAEEQNGWSHMYDFYPREIIKEDLQDDWKRSPVSLEICGTFRNWRDVQKYNRDQVKYIFDEALKWHISSCNAKVLPVPHEWQDLVDDWLKSMGYRFVLRRFTYPESIRVNGKLNFTSWWENKGVTPCYKDFTLAVRLKSGNRESLYISDVNLKDWLPGDIVYDNAFFVPYDFPAGVCDVQVAIVDKVNHEPRVKLAMEGRMEDGWYQLGKIEIVR